MSNEISQSVTSRRSDIPPGYIPISSFGCHKGNTDRKASEEYKALYQAWCDERIGGIKLMKSVHDKRGQIFVAPGDADRVIAEYRHPKQKPKAIATSVGSNCDALRMLENVLLPGVFDCLNAMCGSIERSEKLIERLTTAVESIANQPKAEPTGYWRDMNGECN